MSLQNQFAKFEEKIRLTWSDEKLKQIREKDESIKEDIRIAFKDKGYPVVDFFAQGSYATQTCIEPLNERDDYDIDVGVVIDDNNTPDDPVETKKTLKNVLENRNLKDPKIKMPCVTAQYYKEGEKRFHLDYPIYKKSGTVYYHAIGKESSAKEVKKWEKSDPKGLIDWINNKSVFISDDNFSQYKSLVRYMKRWRDYCITGTEKKSVYSIALTVMVRKSYQASISIDGDRNDLASLKDTITSILNTYFTQVGWDTSTNTPKYEVVVKLPVEPYRDIFNKHVRTLGTFLYTKLSLLKKILEKASREMNLREQCKILADDVFGDDFPIPENNSKSTNQKFKEPGFIVSPQGA